MGAAVFAYGGSFINTRFRAESPLALAAAQQMAAAVLLLPAMLLPRPDAPPTARALVALVVLGVLGSGLAYLCYFYLIEHEGPVRTATVSLLVGCLASSGAPSCSMSR